MQLRVCSSVDRVLLWTVCVYCMCVCECVLGGMFMPGCVFVCVRLGVCVNACDKKMLTEGHTAQVSKIN